MKGKKPVKSRQSTSRRKNRRKSSKWGAPMVAGGDSKGKVTYTYPTGNSEDY